MSLKFFIRLKSYDNTNNNNEKIPLIRAELGKIWLSIFNGFCGWVNEKGMQAAERTVSTNGWKSCWKWKVREQGIKVTYILKCNMLRDLKQHPFVTYCLLKSNVVNASTFEMRVMHSKQTNGLNFKIAFTVDNYNKKCETVFIIQFLCTIVNIDISVCSMLPLNFKDTFYLCDESKLD